MSTLNLFKQLDPAPTHFSGDKEEVLKALYVGDLGKLTVDDIHAVRLEIQQHRSHYENLENVANPQMRNNSSQAIEKDQLNPWFGQMWGLLQQEARSHQESLSEAIVPSYSSGEFKAKVESLEWLQMEIDLQQKSFHKSNVHLPNEQRSFLSNRIGFFDQVQQNITQALEQSKSNRNVLFQQIPRVKESEIAQGFYELSKGNIYALHPDQTAGMKKQFGQYLLASNGLNQALTNHLPTYHKYLGQLNLIGEESAERRNFDEANSAIRDAIEEFQGDKATSMIATVGQQRSLEIGSSRNQPAQVQQLTPEQRQQVTDDLKEMYAFFSETKDLDVMFTQATSTFASSQFLSDQLNRSKDLLDGMNQSLKDLEQENWHWQVPEPKQTARQRFTNLFSNSLKAAKNASFRPTSWLPNRNKESGRDVREGG